MCRWQLLLPLSQLDTCKLNRRWRTPYTPRQWRKIFRFIWSGYTHTRAWVRIWKILQYGFHTYQHKKCSMASLSTNLPPLSIGRWNYGTFLLQMFTSTCTLDPSSLASSNRCDHFHKTFSSTLLYVFYDIIANLLFPYCWFPNYFIQYG